MNARARGVETLFLAALAAALCAAQPVTRLTDASMSLGRRWDEARTKADGGGSWTGYSIMRPMEANSYIGTHYSDPERNRPTLEEVVTGLVSEAALPEPREIGSDVGGRGGRRVMREIGILVHYSGRGTLDEVAISSMSLHVDLHKERLYWLGSAGQEESLGLLSRLFREAGSPDTREDLVAAAGMHAPSEQVVAFLGGVVAGTDAEEVRKQAAFWLGQTDREDALRLLAAAARTGRPGDLREHAVFAVSQMERGDAVDSLVALARHAADDEVRGKAVFWLAQKASERAVDAVRGIAEEDQNAEVQRSALFALSQMEDGKGLDIIIRIARSHRNPGVRKAAIQLLGSSEDPRAVEALVSLLRD